MRVFVVEAWNGRELGAVYEKDTMRTLNRVVFSLELTGKYADWSLYDLRAEYDRRKAAGTLPNQGKKKP